MLGSPVRGRSDWEAHFYGARLSLTEIRHGEIRRRPPEAPTDQSHDREENSVSQLRAFNHQRVQVQDLLFFFKGVQDLLSTVESRILWKQIACVRTKVNYTKPTIYLV
jgi:hypothetical protein